MRNMRFPWLSRFFPAIASLLFPVLAANAATADFVWIEGEKPARMNCQPREEGVGHPEFLSEKGWLKVVFEADKVEQDAPAAGVVVEYDLEIRQAGNQEIWARIGYEFVRSAFEWRIDEGQWTPVSSEEPTIDLMELSFWTEVAWLKLGERQLSAGKHTLFFRLPKTKDEKDKPKRILFALDCVCVTAGVFQPYKYFKPGEDHRTDQDREAAKTVFTLSTPKGPGMRSGVKLTGTWEVCRHDERLPGPVAEPMTNLPAEPRWTAIAVPGDKNDRDDLVFAHRLWYRTRVEVPQELAGRSYFLVFPENNLNTTVHVNGQFCGFDKNPFARLQFDVTRGIKPGLNEIWVGIRDAWYGYSGNPNNPMKLRKRFNLPKQFFGQGFQDLAYPVWHHAQSGILVTPELVAAGQAYVSDVFVKPDLAGKRLAAEVTVANHTTGTGSFQIQWAAVAGDGQLAKAFPAQTVAVRANDAKTFQLAGTWENPRLWWPDDPNLYILRTTLTTDGRILDVQETTFGFREWSSEGTNFLLNGIPFHGWADCFTASNPEDWLKFYREKNQTVMRFWGTRWQNLPPEEALDFFDQNGVVVRRSGVLDGEAIGYNAIENDPDLKKLYNSEIKMELMRNWQDQMVAQVKGERNHPSVMLWSIENEWLYINCHNLYGSKMSEFEAEVLRVSNAVRAADPTRLTMNDGGGTHQNHAMPVHGDHYVWEGKNLGVYPDHAYTANPTGGGRGRWTWNERQPRFIGEDYFIAGHHPELAYLGGEAVFAGKSASLPAAGLMARILTEGYRWAGFGGFHFWMGQRDTDQSHYQSFAPRAVFCRQWDWTFASGEKVSRTLALFNDTHSEAPIDFTWALNFGGKKVSGNSKEYRVAPGTSDKFEITLDLPQISERSEGELVWSLQVEGREVYRDVKSVSVLPAKAGFGGKVKATALFGKATDLAVYDPHGTVAGHLQSAGIAFTALPSLETLLESAHVLAIGHDALSARESTSSRLAAWAVPGRVVIVLEQENALKYQALPCELEPAANEGRVAFGEDLQHPALAQLQQKDFFTWAPDGVVYRNAYFKPGRGARSLVQCDDRLQHSALVEVPAGKGALLLSQLLVGKKLASNAVARTVFNGLLAYAAGYKQEFLPVSVAVEGAPQLRRALDNMGLKYGTAPDPLQAMQQGRIAVIAATAANLKILAANLDRIKEFTDNGGYIVFQGLTPEGLADYNRIVGVDHMIRPFRRERVTFPPVKQRLTAGLTSGEVALYSSERIFPWQAGQYVASDTFNYVLDYDEVAPFAQFPSDYFHNMVNGMVSADAWKYIFSFELQRGDKPEWEMTFPKEQEFVECTWIGNAFYHLVTKVEMTFDGKESVAFDTKSNNEPQTFVIQPPRKGRTVRVRLADWERVPNKNDVVGVDNISLKVSRPPEFYERVKPMLNIGAMLEYPRDRGGIVLCNVLYQENEPVPANTAKKQAILAAILRNLKAPFAGKTVIAGANLKYRPIDISGHATAFRDEKGWFGDKKFTFAGLPAGRQAFAGVQYEIYDFPTSPVPTVLMVGGKNTKDAKEIRGIPVNTKADALFFLHTMKLERRMNDRERRDKKKYETLRYVVTYADGQTETIPVYAEHDIHDYRQKSPEIIPGAQLAWSAPYGDTGWQAAAYAKQWNNPRPEVPIKSLDLLPGEQSRGVPVLLAVTAASVEQ